MKASRTTALLAAAPLIPSIITMNITTTITLLMIITITSIFTFTSTREKQQSMREWTQMTQVSQTTAMIPIPSMVTTLQQTLQLTLQQIIHQELIALIALWPTMRMIPPQMTILGATWQTTWSMPASTVSRMACSSLSSSSFSSQKVSSCLKMMGRLAA